MRPVTYQPHLASEWEMGDLTLNSESLDRFGDAVGKQSAINILDNAGALQANRIEKIAKAGDLSAAMEVVSSGSKSGQAMASVAGVTKGLGPVGTFATIVEITADVAGAPADQKVETGISSGASAAVGTGAVIAAASGGAKLGAWLGSPLGPPGIAVGGVTGGLIGGVGTALIYEFGLGPKDNPTIPSGSNTVKNSVKNFLLDNNGKKR